MNISNIIGWKFNNQAGMKCKEIDGVMTIIDFPGGIPSQEDQDSWIAEHESYIAQGGDKADEALRLLADPIVASILEELESIPGGAGIKAKIQARLKGKL